MAGLMNCESQRALTSGPSVSLPGPSQSLPPLSHVCGLWGHNCDSQTRFLSYTLSSLLCTLGCIFPFLLFPAVRDWFLLDPFPPPWR